MRGPLRPVAAALVLLPFAVSPAAADERKLAKRLGMSAMPLAIETLAAMEPEW